MNLHIIGTNIHIPSENTFVKFGLFYRRGKFTRYLVVTENYTV